MRLTIFAWSSSVIVTMSSIFGCPAIADKSKIIETGANGQVLVEARHVGRHTYETLLIKSGNRTYRVPDERVSDLDRNGRRFVYNEEDSEGRIDHEFSLSPRADWLFVTRKLFHPVSVGYLYHLSGKRPVQIRPHGLRFDDAAIGFFARHLHFPFPTIGAGARVIHFGRWTGDRLVFSFGACQRFDRRGATYSIVGYYGLKSRHFGLISQAVDRSPEPTN